MAKESRKIDSVRARVVSFVMPYTFPISGKPGAIIELASGGTKV